MNPYIIRLPESGADLEQDQEWFELEADGRCRRLRIHDYAALYAVPGLYEALVYRALRCRSPRRLTHLLTTVLEDWPLGPGDLRVLDLGAGNGVVADHLRKAGVGHVVGLDLIPEAAAAARRDRPGVYDEYVVADLQDLDADDASRLGAHRLNCLVTVAALGFGDVPPLAFAQAYNLIADPGWLAMTIKEEFLEPDGEGGFGRLVRRMIDDGIVEVQAHHRYCHRRSITGDKLFYVALVARKLHPVPRWMAEGRGAPRVADVGTANHAAVLP